MILNVILGIFSSSEFFTFLLIVLAIILAVKVKDKNKLHLISSITGLIAFFLPWVDAGFLGRYSGYDILNYGQELGENNVWFLILVPVSFFVIALSKSEVIKNINPSLVKIIEIIPIALILFSFAKLMDSFGIKLEDLEETDSDFLQIFKIGFYLTILTSIIAAFAPVNKTVASVPFDVAQMEERKKVRKKVTGIAIVVIGLFYITSSIIGYFKINNSHDPMTMMMAGGFGNILLIFRVFIGIGLLLGGYFLLKEKKKPTGKDQSETASPTESQLPPQSNIGEVTSKSIYVVGDGAIASKKRLLIGAGVVLGLAILFFAIKFFLPISFNQNNNQIDFESEIAGDVNAPVIFPGDENESSSELSSFRDKNQFIIDTYLGTIGNKDFKLFIEKVEGEKVEGYNVTGTNKRPVKGRIVNTWTKPTGLGGNYTVFKLILTEPGDEKWDGEFNIDLYISDQGRRGEGSWKSFNGKLEHNIVIRDRLND